MHSVINNRDMQIFEHNEFLIGVDEVGRGPLAGPVVVGAILVDKSIMQMPVKDSKLLSPPKREKLFAELTTRYKYSIAIVQPSIIDKINILNATKKAMTLAISELLQLGDYKVYVDGNQAPFKDTNIETVVKGDLLLKPISAASIIAKVTRDRIMSELSKKHPEYAWERNSGYGTKQHMQALKEYGPSVHHRFSFIQSYKPL
jgi:ribonuclease HII